MKRSDLPVPGEEPSYPRSCERCSAAIWVGNSTLVGVAEEYPASLPRLLCMECGARVIRESGEEPNFKFPKFQERYLRDVLPGEIVDRFKDQFGID